MAQKYNELVNEYYDYDETILNAIKLRWGHSVSKELLEDALRRGKLNVYLDYVFDMLEFELNGFIWGQKTEPQEIIYPRDWWQAFKARWFPEWLLKKYPVVFIEHVISFNVLYPDFKYVPDNYCGKHIVRSVHTCKEEQRRNGR